MRCIALIFLLMAGWVAPLWGEEGITSHIQKEYKALSSFQADFKQKLTNAANGQSQNRSGIIYFQKPRLIRWDTREPEQEILVVGEGAVWDYFPEEDTVYKYPVGQILNSKTMLRFISGEADLEQDFVVLDQGVEDGLRKIRLTPKEPEPNLVLAYLWVDPKSYLLQKVLIVDFFGNGNELQFQNLKLNSELNQELFEFKVPQGVLIQDNTAGQG